MCCGPALWEPSESEIRAWLASGLVLEEATPDEFSEEADRWRVVMRDPAAFSFAFRIDGTLARRVFGPAIGMAAPRAA